MDNETVNAIMQIAFFVLKAALGAGVIVLLAYGSIYAKEEFNEWRMIRRIEKPRRKDDDAIFTQWLSEKTKWKCESIRQPGNELTLKRS